MSAHRRRLAAEQAVRAYITEAAAMMSKILTCRRCHIQERDIDALDKHDVADLLKRGWRWEPITGRWYCPGCAYRVDEREEVVA